MIKFKAVFVTYESIKHESLSKTENELLFHKLMFDFLSIYKNTFNTKNAVNYFINTE